MSSPRRFAIKAVLSPLCVAGMLALSAVAAAPEQAAARADSADLGGGIDSGRLGARSSAATGAVDLRSPFDRPARRAAPIARAVAVMTEGGGVQAPHGYQRLCARDARFCAAPAEPRPGAAVPVNRDLLERLAAYNRGVNAAYEPASDMDVYGVSDLWTLPVRKADCEDYALAKQAGLIAAGWPRESVLIGVVVGEQSPFHAVLVVRTSKGEFVLDNLTDEVLDWRDTGYTWVIRQSTEHPQRWVRVMDDMPGAAPRDVATAGSVQPR